MVEKFSIFIFKAEVAVQMSIVYFGGGSAGLNIIYIYTDTFLRSPARNILSVDVILIPE